MLPKFILIDGSSLMHRAFYALPILSSSKGEYTNAIYGFAMMLCKLIENTHPTAMAVAFDKSRITFRSEVYEGYKANRSATPPELKEQFATVQELIGSLDIPVLEIDGYEADDIIGTLSAKAEANGYETIIVTGDRDALQLLSPTTHVMFTRKGVTEIDWYDEAVFEAKYELRPKQLIDMKGLMGDSSDNIPGVPGIGEKTALKLLKEYGSVESVLDHVDSIKGKKLKENLVTYRDDALMSKRLATIVRDMPIEFVPDEFVFAPEWEKVKPMLERFELRTIIGKFAPLLKMETEGTKQIAVIYNGDAEEAKALAKRIREEKQMAFALVTEGKMPSYEAVGIAVADGEKVCWWDRSAEGFQTMRALLSDDSIEKITYDWKRVYHTFTETIDIEKQNIFDVMIAAYLADATSNNYAIEELVGQYLPEYCFEKTEDAKQVAVQTAGCLNALARAIGERIASLEMEPLCHEIEFPLIRVLAKMEQKGIFIDRAKLAEMSVRIGDQIARLTDEIHALAGEEFNVNSPKQLGVVLFEKLHLPVVKKTKSGYSTNAEVLEELRKYHPVIEKILEYRMLTKLKSTYLDAMDGLISPVSGRVHTTFNQEVTVTGRLSSSDPNLQNIPVRTELGREIRSLFIPGNGYDYLMSADYSQIELRVLADISQDDNFVQAFRKGEDIHSRTAAEVFGVPMEEVDGGLRRKAKAVNFGIVYGISDFGLSRDLNVTRKEAKQYIDSYFAKCVGVKKFIDEIVQEAREAGYVTTLFGRRRELPEINSKNFMRRGFAERTAMNTPIQGSAADIIKKAMIEVDSALRKGGFKSRMLLQVHDELVVEVVKEELEEVTALVKDLMERAVQLSVPLTVDVNYGENWMDAK